MATEVPALSLQHASRSFGGTRALDDAGFTVQPGEIQGLVGGNGSGKSTLIRILAGYHVPEQGAVLEVGGRRVSFPLRPGRARELGIAFVHQHLGLIPSLSIVENLYLDELAGGNVWRISWREARARARDALRRYGVDVDPQQIVAELRPPERALLAIVRAGEELRKHGDKKGILVLDEPTVFLAEPEAQRLFKLAHELTARGGSAIFVSHKLDEVLKLTQRVTVLRDGRVVGTFSTARLERHTLAELVAGAPIEAPAHREQQTGRIVASVKGLETDVLRDLSFDVHAGEVLGLTGLAGSGFDEVPYHLFGARGSRSGLLRLGDTTHDMATLTPDRAIRSGMALLPADRLGEGAVGSLPIADNVYLPTLDRYRSRLRLDRSQMLRDAAGLLARFGVRPCEPTLLFGALSGGNQQKALLSKALNAEPRLLLLDEPTRGVDVGARAQIFALIRQAATAGAAVLYVSPDRNELAAICDRILVLSGGRIEGALP